VTSPSATFGVKNIEQFELTMDAALKAKRPFVRYVVAVEAPETFIAGVRAMPVPPGVNLIIERLPALR